MEVLHNPDTGVFMKTPVHLDRLKMAYIREQPTPYFRSRVETCKNDQQNDGRNDAHAVHNLDASGETLISDKPTVDYVDPNLRQSSRTHEVHVYYGFGLNPEEVISSEDDFLR